MNWTQIVLDIAINAVRIYGKVKKETEGAARTGTARVTHWPKSAAPTSAPKDRAYIRGALYPVTEAEIIE